LLLTPDAEPAAVLRRVATDTLAQARTSAAPRSVAADVRLGIPAHRTRRAT
ncbi:alkaline shock response membrane anchor protein AmaP, partial [Streptomyces sp. SID10853]|nr:alkaline shock response membrane anchor protein AmaP [Streptomyces sp. SID10853]